MPLFFPWRLFLLQWFCLAVSVMIQSFKFLSQKFKHQGLYIIQKLNFYEEFFSHEQHTALFKIILLVPQFKDLSLQNIFQINYLFDFFYKNHLLIVKIFVYYHLPPLFNYFCNSMSLKLCNNLIMSALMGWKERKLSSNIN